MPCMMQDERWCVTDIALSCTIARAMSPQKLLFQIACEWQFPLAEASQLWFRDAWIQGAELFVSRVRLKFNPRQHSTPWNDFHHCDSSSRETGDWVPHRATLDVAQVTRSDPDVQRNNGCILHQAHGMAHNQRPIFCPWRTARVLEPLEEEATVALMLSFHFICFLHPSSSLNPYVTP